MTTVAADMRTGQMASDSYWTDGENVGQARKVFRIGDALVGFAGPLGEIQHAVEWFRRGYKGRMPSEDVVAILLRKSGITLWTALDGEVPEGSRFYAIGTGGGYARAAMLAGADVRRAVKIACEVDHVGSGGRVRTYKL